MTRKMGTGGSVAAAPERISRMDRKSAAKSLREIARLLEVAGENPHRVRAFAGAARAVETVTG